MSNWLQVSRVREAVAPLLGPGEQARALVVVSGITGWETAAGNDGMPGAAPGGKGGSAAAPGGDTRTAQRFVQAVGRNQMLSAFSLMVTDQRLLALRRIHQKARGTGLAYEPVFEVELQLVVAATAVSPRWNRVFKPWTVRIGFADTSQVAVEVGAGRTARLVSGTLAGGRGAAER